MIRLAITMVVRGLASLGEAALDTSRVFWWGVVDGLGRCRDEPERLLLAVSFIAGCGLLILGLAELMKG